MKDFKVGDRVIVVSDVLVPFRCFTPVNIIGLRGRILYVGRRAVIEFDTCIGDIIADGNGLGRKGYCWAIDFKDLILEEEVVVEKLAAFGLYSVIGVDLSKGVVFYDDKVIARGDTEALFESSLKEKAKEAKVEKESMFYHVTFICDVPEYAGKSGILNALCAALPFGNKGK
jgi:hypothetical protein